MPECRVGTIELERMRYVLHCFRKHRGEVGATPVQPWEVLTDPRLRDLPGYMDRNVVHVIDYDVLFLRAREMEKALGEILVERAQPVAA